MRFRGLEPATVFGLTLQKASSRPRARYVFLSVTDHFEPMWAEPPQSTQRDRVTRWTEGFPKLCHGVADSRGRCPQHTFFYPAEEYNPEHLDRIGELCHAGYGEVEVHLHHHDDTADQLRETLEVFKHRLVEEHGLLGRNADGEISYGFIHGNWALDNSRPDGCWCGVNNELTVLRETGCYADFTYPSAPSDTQTRTVNSIYYAQDDPDAPKSHDRGTPAAVDQTPPPESLLMIQGPLALNFRRRKFGVLPRLENADLNGVFPPDMMRLQLWLDAGVSVRGREDWRFIKLHTHGAPEQNADMLLGPQMARFHADLPKFAQEAGFEYYYVTAREMAALVHQAESGLSTPDLDALRPPAASAEECVVGNQTQASAEGAAHDS